MLRVGVLTDAIETMRPSIVQIAAHSTRDPLGTGCFLRDDGLVLTAAHVVAGAPTFRVGLAMPSLDGPISVRGSFNTYTSEVVHLDSRNDLAILRMGINPFGGSPPVLISVDGEPTVAGTAATVPTFDAERPAEGEPVAVAGYPLRMPTLITTSGAVASAWHTDVVEVQPPNAPAGFTVSDHADRYLCDVQVNPGNSGGPVFRVSDAAVIGVCVNHSVTPVTWEGDSGFLVPAAPLDPSPSEPNRRRALAANAGLCGVVPIKYALANLEALIAN